MWRRGLCAALALCLFAVLTPSSAVAQDSEVVPQVEVEASAPERAESPPIQTSLDATDTTELRQAFRRMKRESGVQWDLRTDLPEKPKPPSKFWARVGKWFAELFGALAPLFRVIFWVGLAALVAVLLYALFTAARAAIMDRRAREDDEAPVPEYRPSAEVVRVLLDEADRLAAEGRYAEAIHVLLYRSIQDISRARPDAVRLSLTSREIARAPSLGERTRVAFGKIARAVERTHFAGRPASRADYDAARAVYAELVSPPAASREVLPSLLDGASPA